MEKLTIFEPIYDDEKLEEEFNKFFYKNNLLSLFTNEHRAPKITVRYTDARSIINKGDSSGDNQGAYHKLYLEFSDYLVMAQSNKSYEEAIFKILYTSRTFQGLSNNIRKVMRYIDSIIEERKFNTWNIVWYTKEVL